MVSITLDDNIKAGQRLIRKISNEYKRLPVYVGGQALVENKSKFDAIKIEPDLPLEKIPKMLVRKKK